MSGCVCVWKMDICACTVRAGGDEATGGSLVRVLGAQQSHLDSTGILFCSQWKARRMFLSRGDAQGHTQWCLQLEWRMASPESKRAGGLLLYRNREDLTWVWGSGDSETLEGGVPDKCTETFLHARVSVLCRHHQVDTSIPFL